MKGHDVLSSDVGTLLSPLKPALPLAMILPEDTKIALPEGTEEEAGWDEAQGASRFPSTAVGRAPPRWTTTEDFAAGPSDGSSDGPIVPISSYTRMTEQYGTTRLDAMDSDEEEEGVGEELPRYTRRGTRRSRSNPGSIMLEEDETVEGEDEGKIGFRGWRRYLGLNGTEAGLKRRNMIVRGGLLASLVYLGGFVVYSSVASSRRGPPPWGDRRTNYSPHPIPVDTDGDVFYCTDLERDDSSYKDDDHRSLNTTFYLPSDIALNFLHVNGPFSIGNVILSSYIPTTLDIEVATTTLEATTTDPIRIIVESIYRSEAPWQDDDLASDSDLPVLKRVQEDAQEEEEEEFWDAWAELKQTSICVMRKTLNETETGNWENGGDDDGPGGRSVAKRGLFNWWGKQKQAAGVGMGVGIYTQSMQNGTEYQNTTARDADISFTVHLQLPVASLPRILPALDINSILMDYRIAEISSNTTFGWIKLHSSLGNIVVNDITAHSIQAHTSGTLSITGNISKTLDLESTQGEINIDIGLVKPGDTMDPSGDRSDGCMAPPADVTTKMGSGNTRLSFTHWDQPCRPLKLDVFAQLGNIEVHQHAAFQGSFEMSTQLGSLDLDDSRLVEDPLGLGRHRSANSTRSTPIGTKLVSGNVAWVDKNEVATGPVGEKLSSMRLKSTLGSIKLVL